MHQGEKNEILTQFNQILTNDFNNKLEIEEILSSRGLLKETISSISSFQLKR